MGGLNKIHRVDMHRAPTGSTPKKESHPKLMADGWVGDVMTQVSLNIRDLSAAGKEVCRVAASDIGQVYPDSEDDHREYLCLDIAYQYSLLAKGFNLDPDTQKVELVAKIPFHGEVSCERLPSLFCALDSNSRRIAEPLACKTCVVYLSPHFTRVRIDVIGVRSKWRRRGRWATPWR